MSKSFHSGFTLIELMVTLAVAAILLTVGVPSFQQLIRSNRLSTNTNEFVATLNLARSEAVKRGILVTVRKTNTNWEGGWQIFTDNISDGGTVGTKDGNDETLRVSAGLPVGYTLRGNNNFTNYIAFKSSGQSNNTGSFAICDNTDGNALPEPYTSRLLIIDSVGRIRAGTDSNKNWIPEKSDGTDLSSCISP